MFVVSHPGTFKYKTKRVVRAAYEMRFNITMKQRSRLDEWEKKGADSGEDDATTEEDPAPILCGSRKSDSKFAKHTTIDALRL